MADYIGTSGWQYRDWRGAFYPDDMPTREWLAFYAGRFTTVEINNTFYRLPERSVFERWRAQTPDELVFAPKMSRFLTHVKRLHDPAEPVARYLDRVDALGSKLGPTLLQLPPTLRADADLLHRVLDAWPTDRRLAIEFRHDTWFVGDVYELLRWRDVALCLSDRDEKPVSPLVRTASWCYLRLHSGTASTRPCYHEAALRWWCQVVEREWDADADVFVYFNNDHGGCAPKDAATLARLRRSFTA